MASFAGRRPAAPPWSVDDVDFRGTERVQAAAAPLARRIRRPSRRRVVSASPTPNRSRSPPSSASAAARPTAPPRPPAADAAPAPAGPNARKRASAARSARRHTLRRAQLCTRSILTLLFIVRLRRLVEGTLAWAPWRRSRDHQRPCETLAW